MIQERLFYEIHFADAKIQFVRNKNYNVKYFHLFIFKDMLLQVK